MNLLRPSPRSSRRVDFNDTWLFHRGEAAGAQRTAFDDSDWTRLDLPHDWAIEGPFDRAHGPGRGALPCYGVAWYRKHFTVPDEPEAHYRIEFDGAMANARVWLNGNELGSRPYGYASFAFDLTPHLRVTHAGNVLAVRLAPEDHSSRWYSGAGINRNVWLTKTQRIHLAHWGTQVTTPTVSDDEALISIKTDVHNSEDRPVTVTVQTTITAPSASEAGRATSSPVTIPAGQTRTLETEVRVPARSGGTSKARSCTTPTSASWPATARSTTTSRLSASGRSRSTPRAGSCLTDAGCRSRACASTTILARSEPR